MRVPHQPDFPEPIARISASSYNSAAFNEHDNMFVWGSPNYGKMGLYRDSVLTIDTPLYAEWDIRRATFEDETGNSYER